MLKGKLFGKNLSSFQTFAHWMLLPQLKSPNHAAPGAKLPLTPD